jgi:hypothetical protein
MNPDKTNASNKRKALKILLAAAILLVALILLRSCSSSDGADSIEGRQAFLLELGWEIDPASEDVRTVQLPQELEGMLLKYNELQLSQGYDLSKHLGQSCRQYSYRVLNYPDQDRTVLATLYVQGEKVIAGDIHSTELNGFLQGLKKDSP